MPQPLILVPRPAPHLPTTVSELEYYGFTNLLPLTISHPQTLTIELPEHATAILLTSALAIPALKGCALPVWCVGSATTNAAQAAGLQVIPHMMAHNAAMLARHLSVLPLPPQVFVHPHGDHAGNDWYDTLTATGHTVQPVLAYHTNRIAALPPELLPRLPQVTHTLLLSAGTAKHLANLFKQANIPLTGNAIAISREVATAAESADWPRVISAASPTLKAVADALKQEGA